MYVSGVRTCGAIIRVPPSLSNLSYRRAFNALSWIIYAQIEMSHSRRSGCLSARQPPSIFCPSRSANRLYLLSKSPIRFRLFTAAHVCHGRCIRMDGIWLISDLFVLSAVLSTVSVVKLAPLKMWIVYCKAVKHPQNCNGEINWRVTKTI